jgi:hypothetical protein
MARDHTRIHQDIWGDDEWRDLSPEAQHLYFVLYTWPPTFCGAGDWQPRKIAPRARGWEVPQVLDAAEELVAGEFVLIDLDTDEHLVRSWIKHDGLYRQPNMAVSMVNARANLASRKLRGVVVHEVLKLRKAEPKLESWKRDTVSKMLDQTAIDPSSEDWASPWDSPSVSTWARGSVSTKPTGSASTSPTPLLLTPTPSSNSKESGARGSRLPEGWEPSRDLVAQMRSECPHVDLRSEHAKFTDYWAAVPGAKGRKADWDATWRNWIRRASENAPRRQQAANGKVSASDAAFAAAQALKTPINGMELE